MTEFILERKKLEVIVRGLTTLNDLATNNVSDPYWNEKIQESNAALINTIDFLNSVLKAMEINEDLSSILLAEMISISVSEVNLDADNSYLSFVAAVLAINPKKVLSK
jgi:hypothetical protein